MGEDIRDAQLGLDGAFASSILCKTYLDSRLARYCGSGNIRRQHSSECKPTTH